MSPFELINAFRTELDTAVKKTIALAAKSPGENKEWADYMSSQGATPKTGEERKELLTLKEETHKGALPIEVRMVFDKHKATASEKLQEWKRQYGQEEWWPRVETPAHKIMDDFIQDGIKKYLGETSKSVSTKTIFSNSTLTTPKYYTQVYQAGTKSEKCPTCMAARPAGTELTTCAFCGSPIFNFQQ